MEVSSSSKGAHLMSAPTRTRTDRPTKRDIATQPAPATKADAPRRERVFSGIQPSGNIHIGNYLGAMRHFVADQDKYDNIFCIVDLHAITVPQNPAELRAATRELAAMYFAVGLDPDRCNVFVQSHVAAHAELAWILGCITTIGQLNRMTQFKVKAGEEREEASAGLFTYPVLMAADILIYLADLVPVGKDQVQHIEMTQDIAGKFNRAYGEVFTIPNYRLDRESKVPGIDGQKMSKSYGNTIEIFAEGNALKKKVMSIVTDSSTVEDPKDPTRCNVFALYSLFATEEEKAALAQRYRAGGMGYGEAKKALLEKVDRYFVPARERRKQLAQDMNYVESVLRQGAQQARTEAQKTLAHVREAVGMKPRSVAS
jgi:tryptophanyl-tRNA synthetase